MENKLAIKSNKQVSIWLFICCGLLLFMIGLGGYTRLTDSGLSMTNWHPIHGAIPPLNEAAWQEEFANYKNSPEFIHINNDFSLSQFKSIFFVEYSHRVLGRLIGLFFLIPFLWFFISKKLKKGLPKKLVGIFILGGLQGLMGWYMVKSGLVDNPHVSHYRLAIHLIFSMIIYSLIFLTAINLWFSDNVTTKIQGNIKIHFNFSILMIVMIFIQTILGAFTAGLDAGLIYNTFPLMGGDIIPDEVWVTAPWYSYLTDNPVAVQFFHRANAILILALGLVFWLKARISLKRSTLLSKSLNVFVLILMAQVALGIVTLLAKVPVELGIAHQLMAFALLSVTLIISFMLRRGVPS